MIVHVRDVERICASVGHLLTAKFLDEFHAGLKRVARQDDAIERIADRKFIVLLNGLRNRGHVSLAARKIERLARDACSKNHIQPALTTNIGVALCPLHGAEATDLLRYAEIAAIDGSQRNQTVSFYEESAANELFTDWGLEGRLDNALRGGDLELHYQPKICVETERIVGAEALMRWHEPEIGPISPQVFISLAESTGQIDELTQFAIQNACQQLAAWNSSLPRLRIAVNITPSTIISREVVETLRSATSIWGVDSSQLTLEVTEDALMKDREASHRVLMELRAFGVQVSIDDFGTGYSSLAYLKEIPADELKIDRSFVMSMLEDPDDLKIVEHAIGIAKSFGLKVVSEGVESEAALVKLRELRCDYAQGNYISKPVPVAAFEALCRAAAPDRAY